MLFVLLWSSGFIGAKLGLPNAEPLTFLLLRYVVVIVLMSGLALAAHARWPSDGRQIMHIAISGTLLHALYLGGVFTAIHRGLPAGITALIVGIQPLLTALGAGALLGERVVTRQWIGLLLGFAGVAMVVAHKTGAVPSTEVVSMLAPALVALLGITLGTLYQKRFCPRFDLRAGSVVQFAASALLTLPVACATETMHIDWTPHFVFALGWLVLVLSIGAISLLNLLIRRGSAVNVARLFYLTPPTTALLAWAVFGETLTGLALPGMLAAVTGVWLARPR
nr:DMT family transporter [Niveibacterium umoris]